MIILKKYFVGIVVSYLGTKKKSLFSRCHANSVKFKSLFIWTEEITLIKTHHFPLKIFTNLNKSLGALMCSDKIGIFFIYKYCKFLNFKEEEKSTHLGDNLQYWLLEEHF